MLLGLGANVGNPVEQLSEAVRRLRGLITGLSLSSLYRSEPVGYSGQPDFYNLVCQGDTALGPHPLLHAVQEIETALGRERPFRNAPRTLDIDLLAHGDTVLSSPDLILPHPRLHTRAFVLVPLAELAPFWVHPRLEQTASELLAGLGSAERVDRVGALPYL